MIYEFARADGKKPTDDEVPTHISVGGREYQVKDFCVDAPARYELDLKNHGFVPRSRPSITVRDVPAADAGTPTAAEKAADARPPAGRQK